jgi:hypothetical protein
MEMISSFRLLSVLSDSTFLFLLIVIMIGFGHCGAIQAKNKEYIHKQMYGGTIEEKLNKVKKYS